MIVTGTNGRRRSVRTPREDLLSVEDGFALCTPEERALLKALIQESDPEAIGQLSALLDESLYVRPVVSMHQFIEDPYYLGDSMTTLYPALKTDLVDLFSAPYREVVLTGSIGAGKCLDGATELYDPVAGRRVTVEEVSRVDGFGTAAWDGSKGVARAARAAMSGYKPLGWLVLESGVRVRMSPDHPVKTPWGYTAASDLRVGDMVASLRRLPSPEKPLDVSDDMVIWVAYMLADGGCTTNSMTFTNADPRVHDEFEMVTMALSAGGHEEEDVVKFIREDGNAWTVRPNGMQWLQRRYDLQHPATHKRVPAEFYGLGDRQLALFLNRIWACDGWVCQREAGRAEIGIALASESFIRDLQQLLLRLGVLSRVRPRVMHYTHKGERRSKPAWSLGVTDIDSMIAFLDVVGDVHGKEAACRGVRDYISVRTCNPNADITPMDRPTMSRLRREIGPISKQSWWPGTPGDQRLGHVTLKRLRETYSLPDWCRWWPDVFWDRVVSYEPGTVLEPVYDVEVPEAGNFAPGGLIIHNTFVASAAICRILYELSCLKDPQRTFGLSPGTEMVIMLISKNLVLAREVMKTSIDDKIKLSPYFMQHFTPRFSTDYTLFPNNIRMTIGSYGAERALGANVFSAFLDETNFPPKRSAQQIQQTFGKKLTAANFDIVEKVYRSMVRRIKSRFQTAGGDFPGMVIMVSSAATLDSFTERKLREARTDPMVFVRDHTAWTSKPKDHFCGKWFYVLCSKSSLRSRILEEGEYEQITQEYLDDNEAWLIEVPVEYKEDFESNIEDSLRDIAGVSTQAISAFFQRVDAIEACITKRPHPFSDEVWVAGSPGAFNWKQMCREIERRLPGGFTEKAWAPRENPSAPRWVHIDTSLSGDSTGFAVGYIDRWVEVVRRDGDGVPYTDTAPHYVIEVILCIRPPTGEQIYMPDLRRLVYELQAHGYPIAGFSSDNFQSVEMHQQIRRHGIHTELISMDTSTSPYDELKAAIYEKRIDLYDYEIVLQELRSLEYDRVKGKIDHPRHSSKDCLSGDTGISLLNGSEVMIRDLVGQEFWVYACKPDGTVVPAHARNVHLVGEREVMRIWFDNGEHLDCTPDHEIMMRDGEFREAKCLTVGDSLMPLYRDVSVADPKHGLDGYEKILDNRTGRYEFTHQLVAKTVSGFAYAGNKKERRVIHHADFNKRNNDPINLVPMEWHDHLRAHRSVASQNMKRLWADEKYRKQACLRSGEIGRLTGPINIARYNRSQDRIDALLANGTFAANGRKVMQRLWADPEYRRRHCQRVSGSNNPWARKDVTMDRILTVAASVTSQVDLLRELRCTQKVLVRVLLENGMSCCDLAVQFGHHRRRGSAAHQFRHDVTFDRVLEIAKTVSTVQELCATLKCTPKVYHRVIQSQGWTAAAFKNAHFQKSQRNHRVVRVEMLGTVPVYDMTVDVHHNFAISAGVFVHNCADALAGVVWGLRQHAARLPWTADADTPRVAVGHDHGWVSDMIPAEDVDLEEVRAARAANSAHVLLPFFIGDD